MKNKGSKGWEFIGENGEFKLEGANNSSYLYFPLANEAGMMSAITPSLHGDIKTGQNTFAMMPVSLEDLHNTKSARNFWVLVDGEEPWSVAGNSSKQMSLQFNEDKSEDVNLEAGMLWHKVSRENKRLGLKSEVTSFVPANDETVELMKVKIVNTGANAKKLTPTAAMPLYARSADNLRDHRHVTSLLHQIETIDNGVVVNPTLSFDERGHKENNVSYGVVGADDKGNKPIGFFPILEDFIGEGGNLEWPEAIVKNSKDYNNSGEKLEGFEAIGALRFEDITLDPGEEKSYVIAIVIDEYGSSLKSVAQKYCTQDFFDKYLEKNKEFWQEKINTVQFNSGDKNFDQWMKWVTIQPILRRIYGCSFLPSHDYGRGGRGWRDLWQDCLALLLMESDRVRDLLLNNFAGIRIDGSNATIIGSKPGEFIADRNNISRVWMDHGSWPFLTTKLYIDQSGDLDFLLEDQSYFKDAQAHRSNKIDRDWTDEEGNKLLDGNGDIYQGNVIEHILVQHLTLFFNVGENNNMLLEGADWNDGLDMADEKGESVAFTALYASNLLEMAKLLRDLAAKKDIDKVEIAKEIGVLFDTLNGQLDYNSVEAKHKLLDQYFSSCERRVSGDKISLSIEEVAADLERKGSWIINHLHQNEWVENTEGFEWYNGYYDNDGKKLEGDHPTGTRMTLTGQVFPIMGGVATEEQIEKIVASADHYLKDNSVGGYRLNTNFKEIKTNLGRLFGFAYGHKENGAMFSHMAVMYGNALYQRGFAKEGYEVLSSIYEHCKDFKTSRIYPGIPEYINERGRGLYHYLTGSASWLLLTMVTQVYGVRGELGNLVVDPKLLKEQFDEFGSATIATIFANQELNLTYKNENYLEYGEYSIEYIEINGRKIDFVNKDNFAIVDKSLIKELSREGSTEIEVTLG
ncbi:GH36-type glycosyl hydrolase domain-containing protein [Halonatronum saccharophilum]|uniref:GH36-type glycosyl hydrolase domain-containing protein n=1 Tax=Halonatronum saccharophilum TaxID=150060 RepID=UPI000489402C|nr:cellobiose phosphorylase [Halonatronum saccharophilum]